MRNVVIGGSSILASILQFLFFLLCMRLNSCLMPQDRLMCNCYLIRGISFGFYTSSMCSSWNSFWICYLVALICFHPLLPSTLLGSVLWYVLLYGFYANCYDADSFFGFVYPTFELIILGPPNLFFNISIFSME